MNNDTFVNAADAGALADFLVNGVDCPLMLDCGDGSRCQIADTGVHGSGFIGSVADRGGLFAPEGVWAADDLLVTSTGDISEVCWWGIYLDLLITGTDCSATFDSDNFQITYYNADGPGGRPGTIKAGPFLQSAASLRQVTRTATGRTITLDPGPPAVVANEFNYQARHDPVHVTAGECLWIEISNSGQILCSWIWTAAPAGNNLSMADGDATPGPQYTDADDFDLAFCVGPSPMSINATGCDVPPPANNDCVNATPIGDGVYSFSTFGATPDGPDETAAGCDAFDATSRDVWFCYTASCNGDVAVSLCGSTFDTILAVYASDPNCGCPAGPGAIACNDDSVACGANSLQSQLGFTGVAGNRYIIRVAGFRGAMGDGTLTVSCTISPCNDSARCQISDGMGHGPNQTLAVSSDRNAGLGEPGFFAADDFQVATGGNITTLCWWGIYRDFNAGTDCSTGAVDDFQVRYYNDAGGRPGALRAGPFLQSGNTLTNVTRTPTGRTLVIHPEYRFQAQHAAVAVSPGECIWVEITNLGTPACTWLWSTAPAGNNRSAQDTDAFPGAQYENATIGAFDLGFCVGPSPVTIAPASCP